MAGILDLMGHIQQQGDRGREMANQRGLAGLLSKGMTANPQDRRALLAKGAASDPAECHTPRWRSRAVSSAL